nr:hypothetical protein CFP56_68589 [Quercus suber]
MQLIEILKQPMEMTATVVENFKLESPSFHDKDETEDSGEAEITGSHVNPRVLPDFMQGNRYTTEDNVNGKEVVDTTTLSLDSQRNFKTKMDIPVITNKRSNTILSKELQGDATEAAASFDFPKIQVDGGPLV